MSNLSTVEKEFKTILKKREMLTANMNSEISDSWARCISNGLDPFKRPKRSVISFQELEEIIKKQDQQKSIGGILHTLLMFVAVYFSTVKNKGFSLIIFELSSMEVSIIFTSLDFKLLLKELLY